MKAIHNIKHKFSIYILVVLYPKDTEKWKQFTTSFVFATIIEVLFCIPKILKNESNSQLPGTEKVNPWRCFVSQRYWKMKAIHNPKAPVWILNFVVLYPKDTEKWKQFTTLITSMFFVSSLFCIPKILKNESNSQLLWFGSLYVFSCFVSQRYWKMKAIHNDASYIM